MKLPITNNKRTMSRGLAVVSALVLTLTGVNFVSAAPTSASLTLGDSRPSQTTSYTFDASTLNTGTTLRCIEVDLGANDDGTGAVTGLDTSGSVLSSSTMITAGSWTVSNAASADHKLRITNATGATPSASGNVVWGTVVNGSTVDTSYYAVFRTFSDDTCSTQVESTTVQFIYTTGQQVSLTVDPTFTFTVAGVASATSVNGATTSVTTTATTVPFGQVTTASNGIAAQDLAISTNANNGYNIYARYTGPLTNAASDTITNHSGTHAAPTNFSGAGTEAFGYTTEDTDLSQFQPNNWAGMETTNRAVSTRATATSGTETTRVGYQAGIDNSTPAGTYTTTVIYTAVPTY